MEKYGPKLLAIPELPAEGKHSVFTIQNHPAQWKWYFTVMLLSLIDVIDGLKHRKENLEFIKVEIEADRADESPKVFTSVRMRYIVKGTYRRNW